MRRKVLVITKSQSSPSPVRILNPNTDAVKTVLQLTSLKSTKYTQSVHTANFSSDPSTAPFTHFNETTTPLPPPAGHYRLIIGLVIPAGILVLLFLICVAAYLCRWVKRRMEKKRDLTPYYSYDQSEADVVEGVLYTSETSSADMLCVVADQSESVSPTFSDTEISFANTNYFSSNLSERLLKTKEMDDLGSLSV